VIWKVLRFIIEVIKTLYGTDKPVKTEVINAKPEKPVDARPDDVLLRELGLHNRATSSDKVCDGSSGQADPDIGKP
jgi:hypothetical protein